MPDVGSSWLNLHDILDDALKRTLRVMEIEGGAICLLDASPGRLTLVAHRGLSQDLASRIDGLSTEEGLGRVAVLGQAVATGDSTTDPGLTSLLGEDEELCCLVSVPLRSQGRTLGVLFLLGPDKEDLVGQHRQLLGFIAHQLGLIIDSLRLCEEAQELAVAEERSRLARELHDTVVQSLYSITLTARATRVILERDVERAAVQLGRLQEMARGALAEMRSLVLRLHPASETAEALQKQMGDLKDRTDLEVELRLKGQGRLTREQVEALLRIMQEALNNVAKHAQTDRATVALSIERAGASLLVEDQGVGFDLSSVESGGEAMGLASMRERTEMLGGIFEITSGRGKGTRVVVRMLCATGD